MTQIEKIKAEIERRIEETKSMKPSFDQFWAGQISAFKGALKIITAVQQEQPEVGLEKEKDLALTWEDVKAIVTIADSMLTHTAWDAIDWPDEQKYYEKVLQEFNEIRKK